MSHYYSKENDSLKTNEKLIYVNIREKVYSFTTDHGVFSKAGLDFGSRLLIENVLSIDSESFLDLGCGYGPLGIIYKSNNQNARVTMTDVNDRAIKLTQKNASLNKVEVETFYSDGFSAITDTFDLIITNPPIRAGKEVVYRIFTDAAKFLRDEGNFIFVINQKQGAPSAIKKCESLYREVEVIAKKSGYYIIKCIK
ncbi:MAG: class I SAM-dependent methyltransferase [Candidatus Izemoplasmatales bacterium]|nr:class I SAM-dependent methyltransferase [Candidatus Izemoplasmatales bacterium]